MHPTAARSGCTDSRRRWPPARRTRSGATKNCRVRDARPADGLSALRRFQRLPARELLEQQRFHLRGALAIVAELLRALAVVILAAHASGELGLLALQRFDLAR